METHRNYLVITANGQRIWDADDAEHAIEQHRDAFPRVDDEDEREVPQAVINETELRVLLTGPTSGGKATMLAARVFGTWDEDTQTHKATGHRAGPPNRKDGLIMGTLPAMVDGKTRRPTRVLDTPAYDPREDPHPDGSTMGRVAFFEYREDAVAAAREYVEPQGWIVRPQYVGRYDLWMLEAARKSWGYSRSPIIVEACMSPDDHVRRHAHVPYRYSYGMMRRVREADAVRLFPSWSPENRQTWVEAPYR